MRPLGEGGIATALSGTGLIVGCGCGADEFARLLHAALGPVTANWMLVSDGPAPADAGRFSSVITVPLGRRNNQQTIAQVAAAMPSIGVIVLVIGTSVPPDQLWDSAFFCSNLPAPVRYVVHKDVLYPLAEYINIFCKPTEQEWISSDDEAVACTLYGNVGKNHSGLHSLFLGREAYERFIDSYYLQDMLGIRYYRRQPEKFYYMLYFALLQFHRRTGFANFSELGTTLWSTIDKIAYCHERLKSDLRFQDVEWIGIELSDYLRRLSHLLHPDCALTFFDRWHNFLRIDAQVGFSHLVTPYAFHDESAVTSWLKRFGFCLWVADFTLNTTRHLRVNGKQWSLLSLSSMLARLRGEGMSIMFVDAQNLDSEGQIKRTSLIVYDASRFAFDDYLRSLSEAGAAAAITASDFRPFEFDAATLWQKTIEDEAYFDRCAREFSAGFAGALALSPTKPYELRWSSPQVDDRVQEYLRQSQAVAEGR